MPGARQPYVLLRSRLSVMRLKNWKERVVRIPMPNFLRWTWWTQKPHKEKKICKIDVSPTLMTSRWFCVSLAGRACCPDCGLTCRKLGIGGGIYNMIQLSYRED